MEDEMFNDDEQGSEQAATGDDGGRRHGENTDDEEGAEPGRCPDEIKDAAPQRENEEKPTGWLQGARNKDWKSAGGRVLHEAGAACMKERGQKSKKVLQCIPISSILKRASAEVEILEKQNHQLQKALHSKEQEMIRMKMRLQKCEARRRSDKAVIAKLQTRLKSKAATTKRRREARGARNKKGGLQQEAGRSDEGRDAAGGEEEGENAEAAATSSICSSSSTARGRWTDDARTRHKAEQDTDQRLRQDIYYAEMMFG